MEYHEFSNFFKTEQFLDIYIQFFILNLKNEYKKNPSINVVNEIILE